ncbi:hypothetical protein D3C71_1814600 [compost metagenome]
MEAVSGDTRCTSGGASAGSSGERRSTPGWHSQLLALETSRIGVAAPRVRASSPTTKSCCAPHGSAMSAAVSSLSCGRYRKDGSSGLASTLAGPVSWGMSSTPCTTLSPSLVALSTHDSAQCVVPRSMPML